MRQNRLLTPLLTVLMRDQRLPGIKTLVTDKKMGFYNDACAEFGRPSGEI